MVFVGSRSEFIWVQSGLIDKKSTEEVVEHEYALENG
jgi:hypothetical protein